MRTPAWYHRHPRAFAVPRAATGSVHGVRGHIDQASIGGLRIDDITADVPAATFSAWRLALGSHRIDLRQARITATVTPTDLTDFLQANGFPVTVRFDPSQPIILVSVDLVPLQLPLAVSVDNGAIALEADAGPPSLSHNHVNRLAIASTPTGRRRHRHRSRSQHSRRAPRSGRRGIRLPRIHTTTDWCAPGVEAEPSVSSSSLAGLHVHQPGTPATGSVSTRTEGGC